MVDKQELTLEITMIAAQGLETSGLFSPRLRTFVTVSPFPARHGDREVCRTKVDDQGGSNPTWQDTINLRVSRSFFLNKDSAVHAEIFTKSIIGSSLVGWCKIPVTDIIDGLQPVNSIRYLSYRVRDPDGGRAQGVIDLSLRMVGSLEIPELDHPSRLENMGSIHWSNAGMCQTAVGIPAAVFDRPDLAREGAWTKWHYVERACSSLGETSRVEAWVGRCSRFPPTTRFGIRDFQVRSPQY